MDNRMNVQSQLRGIKEALVGYRYRHFKGGIYIVTDIAVHSESEEPMVIYRNFNDPSLVWCRPLSMFLSEVDKEKYPDVEQRMRFERIAPDNADRCVCCGDVIPEGRQVCPACEGGELTSKSD